MLFLLPLTFFSSTKLEKRAQQVLPGSKVMGRRKRGGGKGERWPKQCIHI
jgi:hypothetical protein